MSASSQSHYDVLGVACDTPQVVLKAAYRALAKEYHPDSGESPEGADKFIALQAAYSVLSDPEARRAYDTQLKESAAAPALRAPHPASFAASAAVQSLHARFCLYSDDLAAAFQEAACNGGSEEYLLSLGEQLEDRFFRDYFGDDPDVRQLARLLLLRGERQAVTELNELVTSGVTLEAADARQVIAGVVDRHCAEDGLFAEWLQFKFARPVPGDSLQIPMEHVPEQAHQEQANPEQAHELREDAATLDMPQDTPLAPLAWARRRDAAATAVRLVCWTIAAYFCLFPASGLID